VSFIYFIIIIIIIIIIIDIFKVQGPLFWRGDNN